MHLPQDSIRLPLPRQHAQAWKQSCEFQSFPSEVGWVSSTQAEPVDLFQSAHPAHIPVSESEKGAPESSTSQQYQEPGWSGPIPPAGDWEVTGQVVALCAEPASSAAGSGCYHPPWLNAWVPLTSPEGPGNLHVQPRMLTCLEQAIPAPVQTPAVCRAGLLGVLGPFPWVW